MTANPRAVSTFAGLTRPILFGLTFLLTASFVAARERTVSPGMSRVQIQGVIEDAASGDTILFSPGTYALDEGLTIDGKKNLILKGNGAATLVCNNRASNVLTVNESSAITLSGLHLTHLNPGDGSVCVGHVLFVSLSTGTVVQQCDLDGCGAIGLYAYTRDVTLTGCHIHNCSVRPIEFVGTRLTLNHNLIEAIDSQDVILHEKSTKGMAERPSHISLSALQSSTFNGIVLNGNTFRADTRPGFRQLVKRVTTPKLTP